MFEFLGKLHETHVDLTLHPGVFGSFWIDLVCCPSSADVHPPIRRTVR